MVLEAATLAAAAETGMAIVVSETGKLSLVPAAKAVWPLVLGGLIVGVAVGASLPTIWRMLLDANADPLAGVGTP
jgi:hypothetical protein